MELTWIRPLDPQPADGAVKHFELRHRDYGALTLLRREVVGPELPGPQHVRDVIRASGPEVRRERPAANCSGRNNC